jgi:S-DNA-T family DNA segregation ATPase FtsK/SpoIIIE
VSVRGAGVVTFHRPARVFPDPVPLDPVEIAPPPTIPHGTGGTWLQVLLPIVGSMAMIGFALIYRNVLFLAVAGGIAVLMALLYIAIRVQQSRQVKRRRREAAVRYRTYLEEVEERLADVALRQRDRLERLHPDPQRVWSWVTARRFLWERRRDDPDLLEVRVGLGDVPLAAPVRLDLGNSPLTEYEADLLEEARNLVAKYERLEMAPVAVPAGSLGVLSVVGPPGEAAALVRSMVCELAAFAPPEDLRVVAFFHPDRQREWGWMKWLPHTRESWVTGGEEGRQAVSLTTDPADLEVLLAQLVGPRLEHLERVREAGPLGGAEVSFQRVVVIVDGYEPDGVTGRLGILEELLTRAGEIGALVLPLSTKGEDVPSTAGAVLELGEGGWVSYTETREDGRREHGLRMEAAEVELCDAAARAMAPLRLRSRRGRTTTVDSEGLLDLLGLGAAESLDPSITRRSGDVLLSAPIGVGEDGAPVILDLKEAAEGGMGPHGLLVGATGSGKSELLRTLVTALAMTHRPEDLAFVLVDYKGGATFAELAALPHVAGMITNLERDLTLVDRMHEALFGELERRQRALQDAGGFDRVREYQEHRDKHPELDLPPLPTLLVVVDEFGELLTSRPDFLDLFVSIGRTGRSLGMHLLLATQRLDEGRIRGLEGHLRYRVCLRTFSADESLVVLGTRDAFELPPLPGVGFLKVDAGTQRFKAALATRPFRRHRQIAAAADVVREFEPTGTGPELAVVGGPAADPRPAGQVEGSSVRTEMQVVVETLNRARRVRQVWLPPLPEAISLDSVLRELSGGPRDPDTPGWLRIPAGTLDRPREQAQVPFQVGLTGTGGHLAVVGAPRSGKSTVLQTLIAGLALTHDHAVVQVYAIDLGGGGLHALAGLPHVGVVYGRGDREGIQRLMREMDAILADRAALFRRHGLGGMSAYHRQRAEGSVAGRYGEVILVVDNWSLFAQEFEDVEPRVAHVVATGLHYGIHLILSANRWNDIRLAVRDNVGGRLELRLNDPIESEIDRHAAQSLPEDTPGRGIIRSGEQVQVALPRVDGRPDAGALTVGVEAMVEATVERWRESEAAPQVLMLPAEVHPGDLPDPATDPEPGVAIGLEEFGLGPVRVDLLEGDAHFLVLGDAECGKTTLLRAWMQRMAARYRPERVRIGVVDVRRRLVGAVDQPHLFGYAVTPEGAAELAGRLAAELAARLPSGEVAPEDLGRRRWSGPDLVLFIDDYDLVAGPAGNPLSPLVELLAQGRDIGFHVVLARRAAGTARSAFEPMFQRIRELGTPALVMSGDPAEGPLIGEVKAVPLPPGRGFLVRRHRVSQVHTVLVPPPEVSAPIRRTSTRRSR